MDFELPEELRMFQQSMRRFVDTEMIPVEKIASTDTEKLKPEFYEKFSKRAKELGFWKMDIPEEYGGAGFSVLARSIVETELSRSRGAAGARLWRHHRAERARHPLCAHRRDEGEISAAVVARREESLLCPDRARCRLATRAACAPSRCATATITSSTASSASSPAPTRPIHAADGGDRPRQGLARRHFLLHRRHEYARRETDARNTRP